MSNSPLVSHTRLSPNNSGARAYAITRITPHCVVGQCTVETLGNIFAQASYQASSNYGIGVDGRVGMYVEEGKRSWCSSSSDNDNRAVTIECASDATSPYAFKDVVYQKLITLCVDICKRNGKTKLLWLGDKTKTLSYTPKSNEMVLTVHRWFANKSCPGDWMYSRMADLAAKVTAQLGGSVTPVEPDMIYRVQVGAYSKKENAAAQLEKIKGAGFVDAFVAASIKGDVTVVLNKLKKGDEGAQVAAMQGALVYRGYTGGDGKALVVDGDFGANTEAALIKFQKAAFPSNSSEWDGVAGQKTLEALFAAV